MAPKIDLGKIKEKAKLKERYSKQLKRLKESGISTTCIEEAVTRTMEKLSAPGISSMVIYGDPQSGKTEMMICLTAKLLDSGHPIVVHLLNDSVDLLTQNLARFKQSGLAPAARLSSELPEDKSLPTELVILCKKNSKDLQHLIKILKMKTKIVVVDDEADYATPNSEINKGTKTKINNWVGQLVEGKGHYVGVTATPARLNLNNTFQNDTKQWVKFPSHAKYTGQDVFFPIDEKSISFRLKLLTQGGSADEARDALCAFSLRLPFSTPLVVPIRITQCSYTQAEKRMIMRPTALRLKNRWKHSEIQQAPGSISS